MKEVREFFLRHFPVLAGSKRDREVGYPTQYTTTNIHGEIMLAYNRFLKGDYPSEATFRKFLESITFKLNAEDTATETEQGLVSIATSAECIAGTQTDANSYQLVISPRDYKILYDLITVHNATKFHFGTSAPSTLSADYAVGDIFVIVDEMSDEFGNWYKLNALSPVTWSSALDFNKIPSVGNEGDILVKGPNTSSMYDCAWLAPLLPVGTKILLADVDCNAGAVPTVTEIVNTVGVITWSYDGVGAYRGSSVGAFPAGKTFVLLVAGSLLEDGFAYAIRQGDDDIEIQAYIVSGGITGSDGVFNIGRLIIIVVP